MHSGVKSFLGIVGIFGDSVGRQKQLRMTHYTPDSMQTANSNQLSMSLKTVAKCVE